MGHVQNGPWSSHEALVLKEALTICVLSLSNTASFIHIYIYIYIIYIYCDTDSLGTYTLAWGVNPLFFRIPNIFTVNILLKTGKIHSLIAFYKLFLSQIKVKILINSRHLLMVFLDVPSFWLTPSLFNKWKVLRWFKFSNIFVPVVTVILSCFWVVFWPELPRICQFCFTSDDMQDGASDMLQFWLQY